MRDGNKEYGICKEACKEEGCFLPDECEFHSTVANTPMFIRAYFFLKGKKDSKELQQAYDIAMQEIAKLRNRLYEKDHKEVSP